MKYYGTPYQDVLDMPAHRFFMLIDKIEVLEPKYDKNGKVIPRSQRNWAPKPLESKEDFVDFFFGWQ